MMKGRTKVQTAPVLKYYDCYTRDRSGYPRGVSAFRSPRSSDAYTCFSSNCLLIPVLCQSASPVLCDAPTKHARNQLQALCRNPECSRLKTCPLRRQSERSGSIPSRCRQSLTCPRGSRSRYQMGEAQENHLEGPRWQGGVLRGCRPT